MPRKKGVSKSTPPNDPEIVASSSDSKPSIIESNDQDNDNIVNDAPPPVIKKRGRRPKGGKIISTEKQLNTPVVTMQENIILHLRCSLDDLNDNCLTTDSMTNLKYNPDIENVKAYSSPNIFGALSQTASLNFHELNSSTKNSMVDDNINIPGKEILPENNIEPFENVTTSDVVVNECDNIDPESSNASSHEKIMSMINTKLHHLSKELHTDDIRHKKSACFWCTYDFDTEVIHIPKYNMNGRYHVYGCFCSPQCATAHLMNEKVDSSVKFERYQLINNLYSNIYNYDKCIKPAPNPFYILEKFYGSLSIAEFRDLMNTNRQMVVIDKPMTHVFPELYEDNDDFIVSKRTIPKNNSVYSVRKSKKT
jgi:hypothetical protein